MVAFLHENSAFAGMVCDKDIDRLNPYSIEDHCPCDPHADGLDTDTKVYLLEGL